MTLPEQPVTKGRKPATAGQGPAVMTDHPGRPGDRPGELAAEREHLAGARTALRRMRERAQALFDTGDGVAGDGFAAETLGTALARRVAALADDPAVAVLREATLSEAR
jgi:uncharacterized protein YPO0396